ncbi:MAG: DUF1624 domain-containing protein [Oscillospiraceae bacterium]|nr:DUF1624 domain-containing protein [Oscillospiraceae bacterium]
MSGAFPEKPGRIGWLDAWRGAAVLVMIGWHLCWDLAMLGVLPPERMEGPLAVGVRYFIACSFVLIAGISCRFSRSNARRGVRILLCALAITAVTRLAGQPVWFGILHLLGCCILLYAWLGPKLEKLPELPTAAVCLILFFVFNSICYRVRVNVPGLWMFGFRTPSFRSADWYPLFPWLFLFLPGTVAGGWIRRTAGAGRQGRSWPPLEWIGRRALWVYLLHQPVLLALAMLFTGRMLW